jgi:hypothetical protein
VRKTGLSKHTLNSQAKSVLEKASTDFQGIIRQLDEEKRRGVGKKLLLLWETYCLFLARDYTICLRK